jgi:hypothetical protein
MASNPSLWGDVIIILRLHVAVNEIQQRLPKASNL